MSRVLSIWLPQLPLDRLVGSADPRLRGAFAVISDTGNATRLAHLNAIARDAGLVPGMPVADARAVCPNLFTEPRNPMREASLLRELAHWADRFSPRVALDGADGLLLDISGCAHLFGGEESMGRQVRMCLKNKQMTSRIGIADTRTAARALARYDDNPVAIAPVGDAGTAIRSLPVAALDVPQRLAGELARAGIRTISQLFDIKPGELARRFGTDLVKSLRAARGQEPDPLPPAVVNPVFSASMSLPEPIGYLDDLKNVLRRLCEHVCERLRQAQTGARGFVLTVRCTDTGDHPLVVGFARPCFAVEPVLRQFDRPLGELRIDYGADWFRLEALETEPVDWRQTNFGESAAGDDDVAKALSTIGNRFGFDRLGQYNSRESRLPKREFELVSMENHNADSVWHPTPRRRPLRLFRPPERLRVPEPGRLPMRFVWKGSNCRVVGARGPERIAVDWWQDADVRPGNYWRVQTSNGLRLWLLNCPDGNRRHWFVAGQFP